MHTIGSSAFLADAHWGPPGWWFVFPLLWFLFFAFLVWTFAFRRRRWPCGDGLRSGEARLAERYAAGDIDETEFRHRRDVLRERS